MIKYNGQTPAKASLFQVQIDRPGGHTMAFLIKGASFSSATLQLHVIETEDGFAREFFDSWSRGEKCDVRIERHARDGSLVKTYVAKDAAPIYVSSIFFDWESIDEVHDFQVELDFSARTSE